MYLSLSLSFLHSEAAEPELQDSLIAPSSKSVETRVALGSLAAWLTELTS